MKTKLILTLLLAFNGVLLFAQWQKTSMPNLRGNVELANMGSAIIIVGTDGAGVFLSLDSGTTWSAANLGLSGAQEIFSLLVVNSYVFVGTRNGVYVSNDTCKTWINKPYPQPRGQNVIKQTTALYYFANRVYAGTWGSGTFYSSNFGNTWIACGNVYDDSKSIVSIGSTLFSTSKLYDIILSADSGKTWIRVDKGIEARIRKLFVVDNTIYAASDGNGMYRSENFGQNWYQVNNGIGLPYLKPIAYYKGKLFAGSSYYLYVSNHPIDIWKGANKCLALSEIMSLLVVDNKMFLGSDTGLWVVNLDNLVTDVEICLVTVNENNQNVLVWNKQYSPAIDSFYVYKETEVTESYALIGAVSNVGMNIFIDTAAKPDKQSNKYKIAYGNNCNLLQLFSPVHKTMHLNINRGVGNAWNLIWDEYKGFIVSSYKVYRGTSMANMELIGSSSGANTSYSDLTAPAGAVFYQIEVVSPNVCIPGKTYTNSRSNVASSTTNSLSIVERESDLFIYPNPAKDYLNIELRSHQNGIVQLMDLIGKVYQIKNIESGINQITVAELPIGIYLLTAVFENKVYTYKFVKE